ncbi:unnamed protein product [Sphenostylis stenocarpa]|uniref:Uncharacterized protein n=1 Tax=Sphenostylis stenocarpa TaxID=92480 RepID=A0AA86SG87_9FABA|nr:unnamed protein product [Sphenostylis stenocarpa]
MQVKKVKKVKNMQVKKITYDCYSSQRFHTCYNNFESRVTAIAVGDYCSSINLHNLRILSSEGGFQIFWQMTLGDDLDRKDGGCREGYGWCGGDLGEIEKWWLGSGRAEERLAKTEGYLALMEEAWADAMVSEGRPGGGEMRLGLPGGEGSHEGPESRV